MLTYFARHTARLSIDQATRDLIWDRQLVAIHYPADRHGIRDRDATSLDPEHYAGPGRKAMRALVALARDGGYICTQHLGREFAQVGRVEPGTPIELLEGRWDGLWGQEGRAAVLKTVRIQHTRLIAPAESAVVLVGRPRQGTLMRWPNAGAQIADLVEGREAVAAVAALSPDQQEIMCSEFLRLPVAVTYGLPQLAYLVLPVGRTMKDIDVYGVAADGRPLFAQITYSAGAASQHKLDRLRQYSSAAGGYLVLFCNCDAPVVTDGVVVFPIQLAFNLFTATELGKRWLALARGR